MTTDLASASDLRRQLRSWRRERADTTVYEQLSEAYIWVFSAVVIGAMAISAMIQTRVSITSECSAATCQDARLALLWAVLIGVLALALTVAAALGPVMVSPAAGSWLISTPVNRGRLLRPNLLIVTGILSLACAASVAGAATLADLAWQSVAALAATTAFVAATATSVAARWQVVAPSRTRPAARVLTALTGIWLLLIAADRAAATSSDWTTQPIGWAVLIGSAAAAVVAGRRALAAVHALRRADLVQGGSLLSSLSGALAGLDPTLAYDVLVARRWRTVAVVRPARGGPVGIGALLWRDVIRLRRSASHLALLACSLLVPYVVLTLGLDPVVLPAGAAAAFAAAIWLGTALRTTGRSSALVRCFPQSLAAVRAMGLVVPAAMLTLWAAAATPAVQHAFGDLHTSAAALVAFATAMAVLSAMTRWLLAEPPNYASALISSPAGAIPAGLIGSTLRGFDVLLLALLPLLIAPDPVGALISLALTVTVLGYLVTKR